MILQDLTLLDPLDEKGKALGMHNCYDKLESLTRNSLCLFLEVGAYQRVCNQVNI